MSVCCFYKLFDGGGGYEGRSWTTHHFKSVLVNEKNATEIMELSYGANWKKDWIELKELPTFLYLEAKQKLEYKKAMEQLQELTTKVDGLVIQTPPPLVIKPSVLKIYQVGDGGEYSSTIHVLSDDVEGAKQAANSFELFFTRSKESDRAKVVEIFDPSEVMMTLEGECKKKLSELKRSVALWERIVQEKREKREGRLAAHVCEMREIDEEIEKSRQCMIKHETDITRLQLLF